MPTVSLDGRRRLKELAHMAAMALDAIPKNSEPIFMEIGGELQSIYSDAKKLNDQTLKSVRIIGGESNEGLIARAGMLVTSSLEKVKECQSTAAENHRLAETHATVVTDNLTNSFSLCETLKKTAKYLRAVGLQMRIECSRSKESMEMFSVVAQEIGVLSGKFMETAEKIRIDSESARQSQISAQTEISESLHQLFTLADNTEQTVHTAMQEIEQVMRLSLEILEQAGARSGRISQHIGEIVMGIQFHDNMRQRIEHVIKALLDVEKRCSEDALSADKNSTWLKESGTAHAILELQKAQLQNIISEINGVHERAIEAFQEIANEVGSLTKGLSSLEAQLSDLSLYREGKTQDPFESLKSGLRHLHQLIDQGFSLVEYMHQTAAQSSEAVTGLSSHTESVKELSFETHLTAINAMIKAKQMGTEGMALNKLVLEAAIVSERSDIFVAQVKEIQDLISDSAEGLQSHAAARINGDETQIALDTVLEDISTGSAQFKENSLDAFRRASILEKAISKVNAALDFLPDLARQLTEHHGQLEEISRALNLNAGPEEALTQEELEEIRKAYTMEEERHVHEHFIDQGDASIFMGGEDLDIETRESASGEEANKDNDLGDNIELF